MGEEGGIKYLYEPRKYGHESRKYSHEPLFWEEGIGKNICERK